MILKITGYVLLLVLGYTIRDLQINSDELSTEGPKQAKIEKLQEKIRKLEIRNSFIEDRIAKCDESIDQIKDKVIICAK